MDFLKNLPDEEIEYNYLIVKDLLKIGDFVSGEMEFSLTKARMLWRKHQKAIKRLKSDFSKPKASPIYHDGIIALENFVFIKSHNLNPSSFQISELKNPDTIQDELSKYVSQLNTKLETELSTYNDQIQFLYFEKFKNREYAIAEDYDQNEIMTLPRLANAYIDRLILTLPQTSQSTNTKKIITTLTVEQLALLIRLLKDLPIFAKNEDQTNLAKAFSTIFSTNRQTNISWESLNNDITTPQDKAIAFWDQKGHHIQTLINKYKEK